MNLDKDVLLLTDKRIVWLEKNDLFGGWKVCKMFLEHIETSYKSNM